MLGNKVHHIDFQHTGSETGKEFVGKFGIKPFLTVKEKTETRRLASKWTVGLDPLEAQDTWFISFWTNYAMLTYHIVDADETLSPWWTTDYNKFEEEDMSVILALYDEVIRIKHKMNPNFKDTYNFPTEEEIKRILKRDQGVEFPETDDDQPKKDDGADNGETDKGGDSNDGQPTE